MGEKVQNGQNKLISRAEALLEGMSKRDYRIASEHFDTTMSSVLPGVKLAEMWTEIQDQAGRFKQKVGTRAGDVAGNQIVVITCEFEKGNAEMNVVFDASANVAGLSFARSEAPADAPAAAPEAPPTDAADEPAPAK